MQAEDEEAEQEDDELADIQQDPYNYDGAPYMQDDAAVDLPEIQPEQLEEEVDEELE